MSFSCTGPNHQDKTCCVNSSTDSGVTPPFPAKLNFENERKEDDVVTSKRRNERKSDSLNCSSKQIWGLKTNLDKGGLGGRGKDQRRNGAKWKRSRTGSLPDCIHVDLPGHLGSSSTSILSGEDPQESTSTQSAPLKCFKVFFYENWM